jgi:hypothetical protein
LAPVGAVVSLRVQTTGCYGRSVEEVFRASENRGTAGGIPAGWGLGNASRNLSTVVRHKG